MRRFAEDPPAEERLGEALRAAGDTLATAESCTGGLIASLLTDVPGSSDYFDRGLVTYSYASKQACLGVSREALDAHGAVSDPVAREMAAGIRDIAGTTWGLATTGVAGPGGDTEDKPIGTAFVGVAYAAPWGSGASSVESQHHRFDGDRLENKELIARTALRSLLDAIDAEADRPEP